MKPLLFALDAGTTGVTACAFDPDLRQVARSYAEFPQHFPQPGWVEHDGADILDAVERVLGEVAERVTQGGLGVPTALGLTNQRETVFAMGAEDGRPLRRGIVWQDRRTRPRCEELRRAGKLPLVRARTGLVLDPYFSATKIQWMLEQEPDLAARAAAGGVRFGTVDTLVIAHLTGSPAGLTDPTNASRTLLFDLDARRWDPELCALFGVQAAWLPEVRPSVGSFGTTDPARAAGLELPILGLAGDQQAALFGQGCVEAGDLKVTIGTGSFLLLHTGARRVDSHQGLLTTLAVDARGRPAYALEGSVFTSGALVQWLRDGLGIIDDAAELEPLAREVPDSGGVFVVPAFAGLGAPHWDPEARGAILGLSRGSTAAHVARASLEAIAFQNTELIEILRAETGLPLARLRADGGVAKSDLYLELQADLAALTTLRGASVEATARGAAALAGLGAGLWEHPRAAGAFSDPEQAFAPSLDEAERRARLARWAEAVERVRVRTLEP